MDYLRCYIKLLRDLFKLRDGQRLFKHLHKGYESALNSLICRLYVAPFARQINPK